MTYHEVITKTLIENDTLCMDDEADRKTLAKNLDEAIDREKRLTEPVHGQIGHILVLLSRLLRAEEIENLDELVSRIQAAETLDVTTDGTGEDLDDV